MVVWEGSNHSGCCRFITGGPTATVACSERQDLACDANAVESSDKKFDSVVQNACMHAMIFMVPKACLLTSRLPALSAQAAALTVAGSSNWAGIAWHAGGAWHAIALYASMTKGLVGQINGAMRMMARSLTWPD